MPIFMKVDGIDGESEVEGAKGFIELLSCNLAADGARSQDSGNAAQQGVRFKHVACTKASDTTTPLMFDWLTRNADHMVEIRFVRTGPNDKPVTFLKIKLTKCGLAGMQVTSSGGSPVDSFGITFSKIDMDAYGIGDALSGVPNSWTFDVFAHR